MSTFKFITNSSRQIPIPPQTSHQSLLANKCGNEALAGERPVQYPIDSQQQYRGADFMKLRPTMIGSTGVLTTWRTTYASSRPPTSEVMAALDDKTLHDFPIFPGQYLAAHGQCEGYAECAPISLADGQPRLYIAPDREAFQWIQQVETLQGEASRGVSQHAEWPSPGPPLSEPGAVGDWQEDPFHEDWERSRRELQGCSDACGVCSAPAASAQCLHPAATDHHAEASWEHTRLPR